MSVSEQADLIDYVNSGKSIYFEGTNISADHTGTDFWELFGADHAGVGIDEADVTELFGMSGSFGTDMHFDYVHGSNDDCDVRVNRLDATEGTAIFECQNPYDRIVANQTTSGRVIASTVIFGALINEENFNLKRNLMSLYLSWLLDEVSPDLWSSTEAIDFGGTLPNIALTETFYLQNQAQQQLNISSITLVGADFVYTGPSSLDLDYGETASLEIEFPAVVQGNFDGTLTLLSNDPDLPELIIDLTAECFDYPAINVVQTELTGTPASGNTSTTTLSLQNTGGGYLNYILDPVETTSRGSGGPDVYGHNWIDSNESDGPQFVWNDISSIGNDTGLEGVDDFVEIDLPIYFRFYGEEKNSMKISTNGYLTFGEDGNDHTNDAIPYAIQPNDFIAPLWDDLRTGDESYCYTYFDEEEASFTIQWQDWKFYTGGGSGNLNFQAKLYESGDIYFYYDSLEGTLTSLTVGIENASADDGLQIAYNEEYLEDQLAIRISHNPHWLQFDSWEGYIFAGEQEDITVTFDATNLGEGSYSATLQIFSDDPNQPITEIPVNIDVGPVSAGNELVPNKSQLFQNFPNPFNPSTTISFSLTTEMMENTELIIYNLKGQKVKDLSPSLCHPELVEGQGETKYSIVWNGKDESDKHVSSGVYFYKLIINGNAVGTKRMLLLK